LGLALICYNSASKHETVSGDGAMMTKIVAVCCINVANELEGIIGGWKVGQGSVIFQRLERDMRESMIGSGTPIDDAPVNGVPLFKSEVEVLGAVLSY
jgi:hypothetical protein